MPIPTSDEIAIAKTIFRYHNHSTGDVNLDDCRRIVSFLADDMMHEGAAWKNALLFKLTGTDAVCDFKD